MDCFVTGASGYIGRQLVKRLLTEGHRVGALAFDDDHAERLKSQGARAVVGTPETIDPSFKEHLFGVEILFHCDAYLDIQGTLEVFRHVNVVGTRRLIDAAIAAKVRRMVYLSSQAVAWDGHELIDADEGSTYPAKHLDPYSESRAEAERLVLVAARAGRIEAVAIRPGWTWGPGDTELLPLLVGRALRGGIPLVGDGETPTATTYFEHLLDALINAATRSSVSGKAYFVSDDAGLTHRKFFDLQLGAAGLVPCYRHIPNLVAQATAAVVHVAAPLVGTPAPLIRLLAGMAAHGISHNTRPAREELGFEPRIPLDEGVARLTAWAQSIGGASALAALSNLRPTLDSI